MKEFDIAIIGASLGGVMAAVSACKSGKKVLLTEESIWVGGQLTTQAVPPDEHKWIEKTGATQSYRDFREQVRAHYRSLPNISDEIKNKKCFCPGNSWVSRVAHEPKVALEILNSYLQPFVENGQLAIKYRTIPTNAVVENDVIKSVELQNLDSKEKENATAKYFLDGTDCGDLLPIVKAEYRTGAESKAEFNELHAPLVGNSQDMQPITWVIAGELVEDDEEYKIEKPEMYDFFADINMVVGDKKLFSWYAPDAITHGASKYGFFNDDVSEGSLGLFSYRRIISKNNYKTKMNDVSLINWPQNDFNFGNIYECEDKERNKYLARQQSLSLIYWLQNFAPRKDGEVGYKIKPNGEVMGTDDGLALMPYIRESRRIVGEYTIKEQDVSKKNNPDLVEFDDSVGVGHYSIDVHATTKTGTFLYDATQPFEIPLGALIPKRLKNLLPACKNISCTHLTNGCYRLHPVEWNVGETAGFLASFCIDNNLTAKEVRQNKIKEFQTILEKNGIVLHWDKKLME